jgi:hypothetical protein
LLEYPSAIAPAIFSPIGPRQTPSASRQARPSCFSGVPMTRCAYWVTFEPRRGSDAYSSCAST